MRFQSTVTFGRTYYRPLKSVIKQKLPDTCAKMTLAHINLCFLIAQFRSFFEQPKGTDIKQCVDKFALRRVELPPDILKGTLIYIANYDSAARAAKDIAEWVDMNAFGTEERSFAVGLRDLLDRVFCNKFGEFDCRPAGETTGVIVNSPDILLLALTC